MSRKGPYLSVCEKLWGGTLEFWPKIFLLPITDFDCFLRDLQALYTAIETEVSSAEAVLAEKKKSMRLLEVCNPI